MKWMSGGTKRQCDRKPQAAPAANELALQRRGAPGRVPQQAADLAMGGGVSTCCHFRNADLPIGTCSITAMIVYLSTFR
jgi:hypothetical protein